jgi:hypothetical protein
MFGKSDKQKEREMRQQEQEKQRRMSMAQSAMQAAQSDGSGAEVLRQLSEIDDLPTFPGATLDQFVSKIISTSNLSEEDIKSDEWVREYILLLYKSQFPPDYGLTGHARAYALDDSSEKRDPLDGTLNTQIEAFKHTSGLALTRSEDMEATKEATRTIAESIARDESRDDSGSGGLLGKIGLK